MPISILGSFHETSIALKIDKPAGYRILTLLLYLSFILIQYTKNICGDNIL